MIQILVIDDDVAVRTFLKRVLGRQGYTVHLAEDGAAGLKKAFELHPSLVICDWMMPGLSGIEVCQKIKANPELSVSTFFILLTSLGTTEDKVIGLDSGADDFLCKPIEIVELQARVRAALRLQKMADDLHNQKLKLETEFAEAAQYVQSLLPPSLHRARVKIDSCFIPSSQLGGDAFDYFWLDRQRLAFYLLDVSGHGLKAALPSIAILNLMRSRNSYQGVNYGSPKSVLRHLTVNCQFTEEQQQYFTMWYGVYDIEERIITYASAGHPPALLFADPKDDSPLLLRTTGFPIGLLEPDEMVYEEKQQYIPFNSRLYLLSDGVYENAQAKNPVANWKKFISILAQPSANQNLKLLSTIVGDRLHDGCPEDNFSIMQLNF